MTTAEQILVVFLSTALAIFLVVAIIAGIQAIRLLKTLNRVADKAETLANSAESAATMVRQTIGALSLSRFVRSVVNFAHKKEGKEKGGSK